MALSDDFEHIHASFLHRKPLPTLDAALTTILFEETHKATLLTHSSVSFEIDISTSQFKPIAPKKFPFS